MRLTKLKISGFKSFAEKVAIDFDSEIIAIVGPNGCGKSNIVDAFRWVMGEQSAKSMRGEKMHDVLFAGTEKRAPLNIAEVSVTLSEVEGVLSVPFDEVTITRRLYRSGESEYLLNKDVVRLKDIQDLLLGSGIGKNAFSIFEQGKLDQIIHLNPSERRAIFDDAAGIGRFLLRKKETIRKLEQVRENYDRIKDIHIEVEKQTRSLKRQAAQAETYNQNKSKLEKLEKDLLLYRWKQAATKGHGFHEKLQKALEGVQKKNTLITSFENEIKKLRNLFFAKEQKAKEGKEKLYQTQSTFKIHLADIERQKQRLSEIEKREKSLLNGLEELAKTRKAEFDFAQEKEKLLSQVVLEKEESEKEASEKRVIKEGVEKDLIKLRELLKQLQKNHFEALQKQNQIEKELHQKQLQFESRKERLTSLTSLIREKKEALKKAEKEIAEKEKSVSEILSEINALKETLKQLDGELSQNRVDKERTQKDYDVLTREIAEMQARETSLIRLRQDFEGFSSGAKELLKESKNAKSPIFDKLQPLFEYLSPAAGYEKVLASALHGYTYTLVVKNSEDLGQILDFARKKKLQDFSLITLDKLDPRKKQVSSSLLDHIENSPLAAHLIQDVKIAETVEEALSAGGSPAVTHEGFFFDNKCVLFHVTASLGEKNTFIREAELKEVGERLLQLKKKRQNFESQLQDLEMERSKFLEKRKAIDEKWRKREMDIVQENFTLQRALSDLEKGSREISKLEKEEQELALSRKEEEKPLELLACALKAKMDEVADLSVQSQMQEKKLVELERQFQNSSYEWNEAEKKFHVAESRFSSLSQELKFFEAKDLEGEKQQKKSLQDLQEIKKTVVEIEKFISEKEIESGTISIELEMLTSSSQNLENDLEAEKRELGIFEEKLSAERVILGELEEKRRQIEISLAEDSSLKREIESELEQRYSLKIEQIKESSVDLDLGLEESEKAIRELRRTLENAGPINLMAIEEFKEHEERFQMLDKQLTDLEGSKNDLEQVIGQLDGESRKIFKSTFLQIRENFVKNFSILFNGGEADLRFTDSLDVLEAGIEIVAKPPGKQMRSISLLSGGEKCLTALALLFSIFEVRPAPFCILDEVDAPLDDTNIDRFTNVLKQFINKTQFIVVTHNKKTMSIADPLIGVTMEEKGVSRLISLSFEKRQAAPI